MNLTDWIAASKDSLMATFALVLAYVPKLLGALVLLLIGFVLARLVGAAAARVLASLGLNRLLGGTAIQGVLDRTGTKKRGSEFVGMFVFWLIFLLFVISATETLGLEIVSNALTEVAYYIPKLGVGILILTLGLVAAGFIRELISLACSSAGIPQGGLISQAFYVAALLVIIVTAISQLGVDTTLLNTTITILFAGLIAGAALSFGLGARAAVANLIAAHYLQPVLRVGQRIRVGQTRGDIVAVTPVAVVVETEEGRVIVPAAHFADTPATITKPEA